MSVTNKKFKLGSVIQITGTMEIEDGLRTALEAAGAIVVTALTSRMIQIQFWGVGLS